MFYSLIPYAQVVVLGVWAIQWENIFTYEILHAIVLQYLICIISNLNSYKYMFNLTIL
jgi:hypothetical protein